MSRKLLGFLYCDNHKDCQGISLMLDTERDTFERVRARGWHVWEGMTMGGEPRRVILCNRCVGNKPPVKAQVLDDEVPLF